MGAARGAQNQLIPRIPIEGPVPAELFWLVISDTDARCLIDNRAGASGGKATVGSRTPDLRVNEDGPYYVSLGAEAAPARWEANHVENAARPRLVSVSTGVRG